MTSAIATATEMLTTNKRCLCKTSDFARKIEQLVWTIIRVCICLTTFAQSHASAQFSPTLISQNAW